MTTGLERNISLSGVSPAIDYVIPLFLDRLLYPKILKPNRVNVKIANKKGRPLFSKTIVIENIIDLTQTRFA
ncbi:hypothetical protein OUZ56_020387 [Daphnia magna]|uniref:Uncharacterized protein n=1 Tax=Daphnia magna TaxID=35525 RepID=A0ABQ9ZF36_9CRUS|nr:hypothetical protein OUZ56_020387 [Daphnia magna]